MTDLEFLDFFADVGVPKSAAEKIPANKKKKTKAESSDDDDLYGAAIFGG